LDHQVGRHQNSSNGAAGTQRLTTTLQAVALIAASTVVLTACGKKDETATPAKVEPPRPVRVI
jgi:hypothetical protein